MKREEPTVQAGEGEVAGDEFAVAPDRGVPGVAIQVRPDQHGADEIDGESGESALLR